MDIDGTGDWTVPVLRVCCLHRHAMYVLSVQPPASRGSRYRPGRSKQRRSVPCSTVVTVVCFSRRIGVCENERGSTKSYRGSIVDYTPFTQLRFSCVEIVTLL